MHRQLRVLHLSLRPEHVLHEPKRPFEVELLLAGSVLADLDGFSRHDVVRAAHKRVDLRHHDVDDAAEVLVEDLLKHALHHGKQGRERGAKVLLEASWVEHLLHDFLFVLEVRAFLLHGLDLAGEVCEVDGDGVGLHKLNALHPDLEVLFVASGHFLALLKGV